jgi:beta-galactosidase
VRARARSQDTPPALFPPLSSLSQVGGGHFLADPLPGEAAKPAEPAAARVQGAIPVTVTYTVSPDGGVRADWGIDASDALPAPLPWGFKSLPRVGVHLALAGAADPPVAWYGAGPHEAYPDRKDSAPVRAHAVPKASDLHVPYIFPGECGGRADVRWLAVGRVGLASLAEASLQANVSRFPLASFSAAGHDEELVADGAVHVHLDAAHMGVGGDDSWSPAVWEEYAVEPKAYDFSVLLVPADDVAGAAAAAAARWLARG